MLLTPQSLDSNMLRPLSRFARLPYFRLGISNIINDHLEPYSYEPLDPKKDEIRLLRLLPAEHCDDQIRGSIFTVCLSDDSFPAYNALSYTWGDPDKCHEIWIDNKEIGIGRNLNQALRDIRSPNDSLVIWIDAICIDQSNMEERCHQVQLMRRVYSNANVVRAWLDEEVDASSAPFMALKEHGASVDLNIGDRDFWFPVSRIFTNTYWSRLWVQQEMLLAKRLVFNFRTSLVDAQYILPFLETVQAGVTDMSRGRFRIAAVIYSQIYSWCDGQLGWQFVTYYYGKNPLEYRFQLYNLYLDSAFLRSSDPRDQIYGLIGIAQDLGTDDIIVDYSVEPLKVFTQLHSLLLRKHNSLQFLSYLQESSYQFLPEDKKHLFQDAPSWFLIPGNRSKFTANINYDDRRSCGELGPIGASIQIDLQNNILLHARGIKIDLLSKTGQDGNIEIVPFVEWYQDLHDIIYGTTDTYNSTDWSRTILINYITSLRVNEKKSVVREQSLLSYYEFLSQVARKTEKQDLSIMDLRWDPNITNILDVGDISIVQALRDLFTGRRFFLTKNYGVGLTRNGNLLIGDEIWILFGCPVPLILRKRESSGYTLVSQCWIEGMMDGEAVEGITRDGQPLPNYSGPPVQDVVLW